MSLSRRGWIGSAVGFLLSPLAVLGKGVELKPEFLSAKSLRKSYKACGVDPADGKSKTGCVLVWSSLGRSRPMIDPSSSCPGIDPEHKKEWDARLCLKCVCCTEFEAERVMDKDVQSLNYFWVYSIRCYKPHKSVLVCAEERWPSEQRCL